MKTALITAALAVIAASVAAETGPALSYQEMVAQITRASTAARPACPDTVAAFVSWQENFD
jgi:hypothetical protein